MAEKFEYKYNAPTQEERKEIENILDGYLPVNSYQSKVRRVKELNAKVQNIPTAYALSIGVIGILVFGLGMTCALEWNKLLLGVLIGVVGIIICAAAYPVYSFKYKKLKDKYSEEIIKLSLELLNKEEVSK